MQQIAKPIHDMDKEFIQLYGEKESIEKIDLIISKLSVHKDDPAVLRDIDSFKILRQKITNLILNTKP